MHETLTWILIQFENAGWLQLDQLVEEFELPSPRHALYHREVVRLVEWCKRQGQIEHLYARFQEMIRDDH